MVSYEIGGLAQSLAGHDRGKFFIIFRDCGEYVYLVDGRYHTLKKPKRKNKKHVQTIHHKDEILSNKLMHEEHVTDEEVRRFIRCYERENQARR